MIDTATQAQMIRDLNEQVKALKDIVAQDVVVLDIANGIIEKYKLLDANSERIITMQKEIIALLLPPEDGDLS